MNNIIFLLLFITYKINTLIILPFYSISNNINNNNNLDEIISYLFNNNLYINLTVGTPKIQIKFLLKFCTHFLSISSNFINNNISSTFFNNISNNYISYDTFLFNYSYNIYDINKITEIKINNFSFIYDKKNKENILGISFYDYNNDYQKTNLINQLKNKNIIDSYIYSILYENNNTGKIFIGKFPHEFINNNNIINKENIIYYNSEINMNNFDIKFNNIVYGNESVFDNEITRISIEEGMIRGNYKFKQIIDKDFFSKYFSNNLCEIKSFSDFNYYVCNKKINIKKFKNIIFYFDKKNYFVINYNDVFYEFNNKLIFLIYFRKTFDYEWKLTKIFFNKNKYIFFDQNKKIFGFYSKKINKNNKNNKNFILFILLFFSIIIIILLIIKLYYNKKNKSFRYLRANELEDAYNYIPNNEKNKYILSN